MAKHDQRILRYLDQNRDRGPTITEMMTKLSISISEISDSLIALELAGMVTKRSNAHGVECWFPMAAPLAPQVEAFKAGPVLVQHIHPVEHAVSQIQTRPSALNQNPPSEKGVGFLTFAIGLIAVAAFSTWLASRLATNEMRKASRTFADQKSLTEATGAMENFQTKTNAHITALEAQVKQLREQLVVSQSAVESLQVAKTQIAPPAKVERKVAAKTAKAKSGKKVPVVKVTKVTKASKTPKLQSVKSMPAEENTTSEATYERPSGAVPEPPGLSDQDLPPPPPE